MILKVTKKLFTLTPDIYFLKYILRDNVWGFFWNETSILVFAKLAIFQSI